MNFGNWVVNDFGIIGLGKLEKIQIARGVLADRLGKNLYSWLIHISEKEIVTEFNVYEFNAAFIFALTFFEIGFSEKLSLSDSFAKQIQIISEKTGDVEFEGGLMDVDN